MFDALLDFALPVAVGGAAWYLYPVLIRRLTKPLPTALPTPPFSSLRDEIEFETGFEDEKQLLEAMKNVLRVLPSSLGRFWEHDEQHREHSYTPNRETARQVAAVGRVMRGMQNPTNRYRPIMTHVIVADLMELEALRIEFADLLPLFEGLSFKQMLGLSCLVIDYGGMPLHEAFQRMRIPVEVPEHLRPDCSPC